MTTADQPRGVIIEHMTDQDVHPDAARWDGWRWREPDRGEHFRRCSFCGSIHPEDLAAEPAWFAEWSDRKYGWPHKFYVDVVNRDPDRLYVCISTRSEEMPKPLLKDTPWVAVADLTGEQRVVAEQDGWLREGDDSAPTHLGFGTRSKHHAKFYSIHLKDRDLAPEDKRTIERVSGLVFDFSKSGRVAWRPARDAST